MITMQTFIAGIVGGAVAILGQLVIEHVKSRRNHRRYVGSTKIGARRHIDTETRKEWGETPRRYANCRGQYPGEKPCGKIGGKV